MVGRGEPVVLKDGEDTPFVHVGVVVDDERKQRRLFERHDAHGHAPRWIADEAFKRKSMRGLIAWCASRLITAWRNIVFPLDS